MKVFIPSKGRPSCRSYWLIKNAGLTPYVVVEKQDEIIYRDAGISNLIVLDKAEQGIGYARQYILNYCRSSAIEWFWMLDDDLTALYIWNGEKLVRENAVSVLGQALAECQKLNGVAVAGLDFRQFAWSHKGKNIFNTQVCAAVLVSTSRTSLINYPNHLMEDRDFCIQAILSGYRTLKFTKFAFNTPPMGKEGGGCQMMGDRQRAMKLAVKSLRSKYGKEIIHPYKKKNGWYDCRIKWKLLTSPK